MATKWQISGDYFETCSCDYVCPCIPTNLKGRPTQGDCHFAMVYQIDKGRHGRSTLDGLSFAVVGRTPAVMGEGNWSVGLIVDERATPEQQQAITAIVSGQAGGPMAALAPLIGTFLGVETRRIEITKNGMTRSVSIPGVLDQAVQGMESPTKPGEPVCLDNTLHPANARLALAHATRSHLSAFGLSWNDTSGNNNGHIAPFKWRG